MADINPVVAKCLKEHNVTAAALLRSAQPGTPLTPETVPILAERAKHKAAQAAYTKKKNAEALARTLPVLERMVADGIKPLRALKALWVGDYGDASHAVSVQGLGDGYFSHVARPLDKVTGEFKPTITGGVRNIDLQDDAFLVMLGADQPKYAKSHSLARAMRQASDEIHRLYKDAGGAIGYIDNWVPQNHDGRRLLKVGRDQWLNYITPKLDRTRMVDDLGNALDDDQLQELLTYVFETVTHDGRNKAKIPDANTGMFRAPTAHKNALQRVLHFEKPGDALQYHKDFGKGDMWGNFYNGIRSLATDTAVLRVFGDMDNVRLLNQWGKKADPSFQAAEIDDIITNIVGFENVPSDSLIINGLQGAQDIASAAFMGSVLTASIPDLGNLALNMALNDMGITKIISRFNTFADAGERELLVRAAGQIDAFQSSMGAAMRFEDPMGSGLGRRLSDANYRLGGVNAWMDRLRHVWTSTMLSDLNADKGLPFDKLSKGKRGFLETYGLDADWDKIRSAPEMSSNKLTVLDIAGLGDDDLSARFLGALYTERDMAIITPNARVRAVLNQGKSANTLAGATIRAGTQFKTFMAAQLIQGVGRYMFSNRLVGADKAKYIGGLAFSMTILGAVSVQLREALKGREPMEMDNPEFFLRAFSQGGAAPLLADLLLEGQTRHGRNAVESLFGPTGGMLADVGRLSLGTAFEARREGGDVTEYMGKTIEKLTHYVPGQSLWWARLGVQRTFRDAMLSAVDPTYAARMERRERNIENRSGQETMVGYDDGLGPGTPQLY